MLYNEIIINKLLFLYIQSDYTRSQYTEKYIEDQVNSRLQELAKSSAKTLKDLFENPEKSQDTKEQGSSASSSSKDGQEKDTLSSAGLQEQLSKLKETLESQGERRVLSDDLQKARGNVAACLKEFNNKPMKCYDQVEAFKAEVKKYEQSLL